jgi:hypothetical protein
MLNEIVEVFTSSYTTPCAVSVNIDEWMMLLWLSCACQGDFPTRVL